MKVADFTKLSLHEKSGIVEQQGKHLGSRSIYGKSRIELYQVYDFYAEEYYNANTDQLEQIITTTEDEIIHNYIDLREVYLSNKKIQPPQ